MTKKRIISFVFGSTALATSMCFLPLADAFGTAVMMPSFEADNITLSTPAKAPTLTIPSYIIDGAIEEVKGVLAAQKAKNAAEDFVVVEAPEVPKLAGFTMESVLNAVEIVKSSYEFAVEGSDFSATEALQANGAKVSFFGRNDKDGGIFVDNNDGTGYIAYRGSSNGNNWLQNLNGFCTDEDQFGGRYHAGMLKGYEKTSYQVRSFIEQFANKYGYSFKEAIDHLTLTGHSRGGGIALIAADMIRRESGVAPSVVTFAAPRVLAGKTAAEYNDVAKDKTLNIAQRKDPVHYANASVLFGAKHVGSKAYIDLAKGFLAHQMGGYEAILKKMNATTAPLVSSNATETLIHVESDNSLQGLANKAIYAGVKAKEAVSTVVAETKKIASQTIGAVKGWLKSWF